jgi:hypothetical protein
MDKWGLAANTFKNFKSGGFEVGIAALRIGTRRPDRGHRSPRSRGRRTPAFERFEPINGFRKMPMGALGPLGPGRSSGSEHAVYEAYAKSMRRTIIDSKFTTERT